MGMVVRNSIWNDLISSPDQPMSPELARYILKLTFTPQQQTRADELGTKAQQGTLTVEEESELDELLSADSFLTIMHSKARVALRQHGLGG